MSVKRYDFWKYGMEEEEDGTYVRYDDYETLCVKMAKLISEARKDIRKTGGNLRLEEAIKEALS